MAERIVRIPKLLSFEEFSKIDVIDRDIELHKDGDACRGPIKNALIWANRTMMFICLWIAKYDYKTHSWEYCGEEKICGGALALEYISFTLEEDDCIRVSIPRIGIAFIRPKGDHLEKPSEKNSNRAT